MRIKILFLIFFAIIYIHHGIDVAQADLVTEDRPFIEEYCGEKRTRSQTVIEILPGDEFALCGQFLPANAIFINSDQNQTFNLNGRLIQQGDMDVLTIILPSDLPPGRYQIFLNNQHGTTEYDARQVVVLYTNPDFTDSATVTLTSDTTPKATKFEDLIKNIIDYAFLSVGVSVFVMIMWGGFLWLTGAANPGNIALAKRKIYNAILGALILAASYVILNTINPELVGGRVKIPPITKTGSGPISPPMNTNWQDLARQYNVPENRRNSNNLVQLMSCISGALPGQNLGEISTYGKSGNLDDEICNYTRGNSVAGYPSCIHAVNSCHYGGAAGETGALAVDYGNEQIGNQIIQVAINRCGAKSARCEDSSGQAIACTFSSATHVHVTAAACDRN